MKRIKMKIGVESAVSAKFIEMEENTSEGRSSSFNKEVVVCVQDLVEKDK